MDYHKELSILIHKKEIKNIIKIIAKKINNDYKGRFPVLICVLKGGFIFMADLIRYLSIEVEIDFVELSSYGADVKSSQKVKINKWLSSSIKDRDVLIIEDVVDTGITLEFLLERLKKEKPSSLKLCSLTSKVSRREKVINIDYLGFDIPDKFIVGYGLDLNEKYRNLPEIYFLK